jgi:acyl dehydratase
MSQDLYNTLLSMLGEKTGPYPANDKVDEAMIRHWCEAMEDDNPLYTDEEYARKSKYGGIIAPPQMVQAYCVPRLWPPQEGPPDILRKLSNMTDDAGYAAVVATTTSHEYFAPLRPGDKINYTLKFITVSPEKKTRLGKGYFLTVVYTYSNQKNEVVCKQPFTIFKFKLN